MNSSSWLRVLFLASGFFVATVAFAQSQMDEIGSLPTTLSPERLRFILPTSPVVVSEPLHSHQRRRLPRRLLPQTPEEIAYRESVQKLGVNKHRFVHCDLPNGKVRTGVITEIRDDGFALKDGIFISQWIPFTDLRAAPRPVPAVGTRIGQGFKWAGVGLGVAVLLPLFPFMFLAWDGC